MYDVLAFDMDGVIITRGEGDWIPDIIESVEYALETCGVSPESEDYGAFRDAVVSIYAHDGPDQIEDIHRYADAYDVDVDELWERSEDHTVHLQYEQLQDEEDARELHWDVDALGPLTNKTNMALVSNNAQGFVDHVVSCPILAEPLQWCETLGDVFNPAYGIQHELEDRFNRKPETHYLEKVKREYGTDNILYIGDSPVDVLAAENAGIDSAFVPAYRENAESEAKRLPTTPTYVLDSLTDLHRIMASEPA